MQLAYVIGEFSSTVSIGIGLPQASFFLDIYVSIKVAEAMIIKQTKKAEKLVQTLHKTKCVLAFSFLCAFVVLISLQIWKYYDEKVKIQYAYEMGLVIVLSLVWVIVLISICLLFSKTKVFLGRTFSSEKCEIYTMFSTLTIGYGVAIAINASLFYNNEDICNKKIENCEIWLLFWYYFIS